MTENQDPNNQTQTNQTTAPKVMDVQPPSTNSGASQTSAGNNDSLQINGNQTSGDDINIDPNSGQMSASDQPATAKDNEAETATQPQKPTIPNPQADAATEPAEQIASEPDVQTDQNPEPVKEADAAGSPEPPSSSIGQGPTEGTSSESTDQSVQPADTNSQAEHTSSEPTTDNPEQGDQPTEDEPAFKDNNEQQSTKVQKVPNKKLVPIIAIITVACVLIALAVAAYVASGNSDTANQPNNDSIELSQQDATTPQQEASLPEDPNAAVNEVISDIDQDINSLDEESDFNSAEFSDENLEL